MTRYEFRVEGHLDSHWSTWLGDVELVLCDDGTSTLRGAIADQAQLHGVLDGLRDMGATLLSVSALDAPTALVSVAWPIHTERLLLRPARPEDAEPTWQFRRLESVSRWLTDLPRTLEAYRERFLERVRLASTLIVESEGVVIGDLMFRVEDMWAQTEVREQARGTQAELGWVFDPAQIGRGYATEAARALLRLSFEELELRRVVATCFADNEASWRLMERLGMRREQHGREQFLHRSGRWLDGYTYALLRGEFIRPSA
jgi:RimJ/RimL family protein N-acetyltransferase